jgi:hypothetical protein
MNFIRSFISNRKIIGNKAANLLGVQVFRVLFFQIALVFSRRKNSIVLPTELEKLKRDGLITIPNYLKDMEFEDIRDAFYKILSEYNTKKDNNKCGANTLDIEHFKLTPSDIETYPALEKIFHSPEIHASFSYLAGKPVNIAEIYVEFVHHEADEYDPCTALHTDTFFPNQNAWIFVEDSDLDCGPFIYSQGSHRVTIKRLIFVYYSSVKYFFGGNGSPRVPDRFAQFLNLSPTAMVTPRNSLLISNNFGIHARGVGIPGATRAAFKLSCKETPFSRQVARKYRFRGDKTS